MSDSRLTQYADRMDEIVKRTNVIDAFLTRALNALYLPTTVESIYLQLRNISELIATASLIVNDSDQLKLNREGRESWRAGKILKAVEAVNPTYFYPQPVRGRKSNSPGLDFDIPDFKGEYLTRDRFDTLYDVCNDVIHTPNPFNSKTKPKDYDRLLKDSFKWRRLTHALLVEHKFMLVDDDNMYIVQVRDESKGAPLVTTFVPVEVNSKPNEGSNGTSN